MNTKELTKEYSNFRKNKKYLPVNLSINNNCVYFNGEVVIDNNNKKIAEGKNFISVNYNAYNSVARMLSTLFPLEFTFKGKKVKSIETVLQAIKYKDNFTQSVVLQYSGLDAYATQNCENSNWTKNHTLYWQDIPMNRFSEEYQNFIDELFVSALANPLYLRAILTTKNKAIICLVGNESPTDTVLTRLEFEERLNTLRDFVIQKNLKRKITFAKEPDLCK